MPIDDWIYWGEDPWYAGVIWKEWIDAAEINCVTTCELDVTYTARPTFEIDSESTVEVEDTFVPQAGASVNCSTNVSVTPSATYPASADIDLGSNVTAVPGSTFPADADIDCASTVTVNETHTIATPADITNKPKSWHRATDYSKIINNSTGLPISNPLTEDGCDVATWNPSSAGAGLSFISDLGARPVWNWDAGNTTGYITFTGTEYLRVASYSGFAANGDYTIFAIVDGTGDYFSWHVNLTNDEGSRRIRRTASSDVAVFVNPSGTELGVSRSSGTGWVIATMDNGVLTVSYSIRNSGGTATNTSHTSIFNTNASNNVVIGARTTATNPPAGLTAFFSGDIYEIATYNGTLTADEQTSLIAYFDAYY